MKLSSRDAALAATLVIAVATAALVWWLQRVEFETQYRDTLAGLPPFPSSPDAGAVMRAHAREHDAGARVEVRAEPLVALALSEQNNVAMVQLNAVANSPFFARLARCLPREWDAGAPWGLDWQRDVDRVVLVPGGVGVSGQFADDQAARIAAGWPDAGVFEHGGVRIFEGPEGCITQLGSTLLSGATGACAGLVDRAQRTPADAQRAADTLSTDVYVHTNLSALRSLPEGNEPAVRQVLEHVSDLTLRANIWDQAALSVDAAPSTPSGDRNTGWDALEVALAATELSTRDDPRWAALMSRTERSIDRDGRLRLDLAVPADAVLERLQLPCPGEEDAGQP